MGLKSGTRERGAGDMQKTLDKTGQKILIQEEEGKCKGERGEWKHNIKHT